LDSWIRMMIQIITKIELIVLPLQEISSKSVHNFFNYPTDRQTDRSENITSFGGGNNMKALNDLDALCVIMYSSL